LDSFHELAKRNIIYIIIGWIAYALYNKFEKSMSILMFLMGIIAIIYNSYLIGIIFLLASLIYFQKHYILLIKIALVINFISILTFTKQFVALYQERMNAIDAGDVYLLDGEYFYTFSYFGFSYILFYIILTYFLLLKKGQKKIIDIGFYLIIIIQALQIIMGSLDFIFLGFPILIILTLLKIQKKVNEINCL